MQLYKRVEPREGERVQFVGVHAVKWRFDVMGPPSAAFVETDDVDEISTYKMRCAQLEAERVELLALIARRNELVQLVVRYFARRGLHPNSMPPKHPLRLLYEISGGTRNVRVDSRASR